MASPKLITFGPQVDVQAQQLALARQQQLADALRAQSVAPIEQQVVSGRVVPNSPWQGVTKLLTAALARDTDKAVREDQAKLGVAQKQKFVDALRNLGGGGQVAESGAQAAPMGDLERIMAAYELDPELGKALAKNAFEVTDEQKNLKAQGIDPLKYGQARMAKEAAGGVINVAPNSTVFNPSTNQPVYAGTDFSKGVQNSFGPNGQPQISRVQGSEIIPQMAGEVARAEAGGRAGFNLITVNTPNGPVMMTEAQAAQMAGGAPRNAGMQFQASNGVTLDFQNKTPQQVFDAAQQSGDPQFMQAFNEWANSANRPPGIPLQSDAQRTLQVGQAQNAVDLSKNLALNAQSPESQQKIADAQSVLSLLDEGEPFIKNATGSTVGNIRDKAIGMVGQSTSAGRDAARLAAIGGQLTSKMPKMSGPQSDKDVLLYKEMAGRIGDPSVPADVKQAAADTIRNLNQKYLDQNQGSMAAQALKATKGGGKQPSIDDLLKQYGKP
jgi:hypothetical protein